MNVFDVWIKLKKSFAIEILYAIDMTVKKQDHDIVFEKNCLKSFDWRGKLNDACEEGRKNGQIYRQT